MTGAGDYNSQDFGMPDEAKCRSWTPSSSSYSSYTYSSYPSSAYSSYSYSSYPSSAYSSYPTYSSCTNEMISLLGTGCHFMYNDSSNTAVYCNGEMTKSAKLGDTAAKEGCQSGGSSSSYSSYYYSSYPSSAYSSYSYSSYSPASSEAAYSSYSSASYSSADYSTACAQAGGTWDGNVCQMPNSGSSSSVTQNPAAAGWLFDKIINFFSR